MLPSRTVVFALLLAAPLAFAGWTKKGEASAAFLGRGPAGFKIEGSTKTMAVKDDGKALTVTADLKDLDTGISLRNHHTLEDAEAEKFPLVTLVVPLSDLKVPEDGKSLEGDAKGTFTLHGVTKEGVAFKYSASCKGGSCDVEASADVNVNDYGIKIRSYMGITVKPDIKITTKFTVAK